MTSIWNPTLRSLSEDEKMFLTEIKDGPKTPREFTIVADQAQNVARQTCARLGLAVYSRLTIDRIEAKLSTEELIAVSKEPLRWHITPAGLVAQFFGYVKPLHGPKKTAEERQAAVITRAKIAKAKRRSKK